MAGRPAPGVELARAKVIDLGAARDAASVCHISFLTDKRCQVKLCPLACSMLKANYNRSRI